MADCKWMQDEICVNADCPMCADYCPVADYEGVCRFEDRVGIDQFKTNGDRIRVMTDEELSEFLDDMLADYCTLVSSNLTEQVKRMGIDNSVFTVKVNYTDHLRWLKCPWRDKK